MGWWWSSQPANEPWLLADVLEAARVLDGGVDLQAVADDAGVGQQPRTLGLAVRRDHVDVEAVPRAPEVLPLLQDREPGQAGLVDLENETLEEAVVVAQRETVLVVVVRPVERVPGRDPAVFTHGPKLADGGHVVKADGMARRGGSVTRACRRHRPATAGGAPPSTTRTCPSSEPVRHPAAPPLPR
jgi:hypothetical protein